MRFSATEPLLTHVPPMGAGWVEHSHHQLCLRGTFLTSYPKVPARSEARGRSALPVPTSTPQYSARSLQPLDLPHRDP